MAEQSKVALEKLLLKEKIRKEAAEATKAEIELVSTVDAESDRLVKLGRIRHLRINDVIAGNNTEKWLDALQHWERREPGQPVTIDIFSPGGAITDGLAIYDQVLRMKRGGSHVTTRGMGAVASMAAVLLQVGDDRVMDARSKMLLHEGSWTVQGTFTAGEQDDLRAFRDMLLNDILDILAEKSALSKRQLQNRWKRKDWWMTADEAVKFGFADRVT